MTDIDPAADLDDLARVGMLAWLHGVLARHPVTVEDWNEAVQWARGPRVETQKAPATTGGRREDER